MSEETNRSKNEFIKEQSQGLRGKILEELRNDSDDVSDETFELLKFHGTYQQDNRDNRQARRKQGLGKDFIFMVRNRIPGGKITAEQFLGELDLADEFGYGALRITTRQGIQLHGVVKGDLWKTIRAINQLRLSTQSACGDVERNVVCCPAPLRQNGIRDRLQGLSDTIADHLRPRSRSYQEIWLEDPETGCRERVTDPEAPPPEDPIYGAAYLPRKFKTGIALCEDNCIDVYDQDVGLLGLTEGDELAGFNLLVGGSMGTTPSDKRCFPALAHRMAFITWEQTLPVVTAVALVQRDFGNRADRKQARMKYLIHNWGLPRFKRQVEEYLPRAAEICGTPPGLLPRTLPEPRPQDVTHSPDHLGWHDQGDGRMFLGLPIENGRVKDEGSLRLKSGLRELFRRYRPGGRLTAHQNLLLCDLSPADRPGIEALLREYGIQTVEEISNARRFSFACPALPTCRLAVTESERVLPVILDELEAELRRLGLEDIQFSLHMTGCPNGCARPYNCDIGIVGRSLDGKTGEGKYTIFAGGNFIGTRMNQVFRDLVPQSRIVPTLRPMLIAYKQQRGPGETLGDFCHRVGLDRLREAGADEPQAH